MPIKDQAYVVQFKVENINTTAGWLGTGVTGLVDASFESFKLLQDGNVSDLTDTSGLTELHASAAGWYSIDITAAENDGDFMVLVPKCNTATYGCRGVEWTNDDDPQTIYYADIRLDRDTSGSGDDEYTVQWFKYGEALTAGVTNAQIYVFDRGGNDLITSGTAMTEVGGSKHVFYFDADGTAGKLKMTTGESITVQVSATIDSATRTWRRIIGRDS